MNAVEEDVKRLVEKELESANKHFPAFRSTHEGWAVIREEADELNDENVCLDYNLNECMWEHIKANKGTKEDARMVMVTAIHAACEAIQAAAMARKYLDYLAVEDE